MTRELRSCKDAYKMNQVAKGRKRTKGRLPDATWKGCCRGTDRDTGIDADIDAEEMEPVSKGKCIGWKEMTTAR
ncbi:MAG: hypothetical protein GX262_05940 [Clostridia bacterium]|nr:hypothetical protein [Clostridia bacterium]